MNKRQRDEEDNTEELDYRQYCIEKIQDALDYDMNTVRECPQKAVFISELMNLMIGMNTDETSRVSNISLRSLYIIISREYWSYASYYTESFPYNISKNWTLHTFLWCILSKLLLLWYKGSRSYSAPRYMQKYMDQESMKYSENVYKKGLIIYKENVRDYTVRQLMGSLYHMTVENSKVSLTDDLIDWLNALILRQAELMHSHGNNLVYNSVAYCDKVVDNPDDVNYSINSLFVEECSRVIYDLKISYLNYMFVDRKGPSISSHDFSIGNEILRPFYNVQDEGRYIYLHNDPYFEFETSKSPEEMKENNGYFFYHNSIILNPKYDIEDMWKRFVIKRLFPFWNDNMKKLVYQRGYTLMLRPGELKRSIQRGMGEMTYMILQRMRSSNEFDYIKDIAFNILNENNNLCDVIFSLKIPHSPIRDAYFIEIMQAYLSMTFGIKFEKLIIYEQYKPLYLSIEYHRHPVIVQIMGGWDVYDPTDEGCLYHCRNLSRAFIFLMTLLKSKYDGKVENTDFSKLINTIFPTY